MLVEQIVSYTYIYLRKMETISKEYVSKKTYHLYEENSRQV